MLHTDLLHWQLQAPVPALAKSVLVVRYKTAVGNYDPHSQDAAGPGFCYYRIHSSIARLYKYYATFITTGETYDCLNLIFNCTFGSFDSVSSSDEANLALNLTGT